MSEETSQEEMVDAIYKYAISLVQAGKTRSQVQNDLKERGLDEEAATIVVDNIFKMRAEALSQAGQKNMVVGGLWFVGGVAVTAITYSAASGGGTYVVAWGAIIFGAVQFFKGLSQSSGNG